MADRCKITKYIPDPTPQPVYYPQGDIYLMARLTPSGTTGVIKIDKDLTSAVLLQNPQNAGFTPIDNKPDGFTYGSNIVFGRSGFEDSFIQYDKTTGLYQSLLGLLRYSANSQLHETSTELAHISRYSYPAKVYIHDKSVGTFPYLHQIATDGVLNTNDGDYVGYSQLHNSRFMLRRNYKRAIFFDDTDSTIFATNDYIDYTQAFLDAPGFTGINAERPLFISPYGHAFSEGFAVGGSELAYISMNMPSSKSGVATFRAVRTHLDIEAELGQVAYSTWSFGNSVFDGEFLYIINKRQHNSVDALLAFKLDKDLNIVASLKGAISGQQIDERVNAVKSFTV